MATPVAIAAPDAEAINKGRLARSARLGDAVEAFDGPLATVPACAATDWGTVLLLAFPGAVLFFEFTGLPVVAGPADGAPGEWPPVAVGVVPWLPDGAGLLEAVGAEVGVTPGT